MSTAAVAVPASRDLNAHPKGLYVLFATEMWERFSFYSMLALFTLYLQNPTEGFGWATNRATKLYALYLALVYFSPLLGGWIADRKLGYRRSVMIGGFFFMAGHLLLSFRSIPIMYLALACLVTGNGFFKPNVSAMVGKLYPEGSHLKDRAYNIFYMGINVGAFLAPLVMEVVRQRVGYHPAFAVAAGGMVISVFILWKFKRHVEHVDARPGSTSAVKGKEPKATLTAVDAPPAQAPVAGSHAAEARDRQAVMDAVPDRTRILALIVVFAIVVVFWMAFHQNGATWTYWANDNTAWESSKFVPVLLQILTLGLIDTSDVSGVVSNFINPAWVLILTFPLVWFWGWLDKKGKEPSTPAKMGIGMFLVAAAYMIMYQAAQSGGDTGRVSPWWLISAYAVITLGELMLSPMGLSLVSKVAPVRLRGLMMGGWFAATAVGNYLVGTIGVKWTVWTHSKFFLVVAMMSAAVGMILFLILKPLKKAMPGV
ncbi:MAG: peptide MFS transporter [Acidobacteriota bacterium]|nr:peptide MFS transporter [Acidobacteriota bacterium]MDQ5871403.1 peptide MFS transporter [Acidobacteriota bacterium]